MITIEDYARPITFDGNRNEFVVTDHDGRCLYRGPSFFLAKDQAGDEESMKLANARHERERQADRDRTYQANRLWKQVLHKHAKAGTLSLEDADNLARLDRSYTIKPEHLYRKAQQDFYEREELYRAMEEANADL